MLPLYKKLNMKPMILACIAIMGSGVMNLTPWGGPTARVMSALKLDASQVFTPLIPAMIGGAVWLLLQLLYFSGKKSASA